MGSLLAHLRYCKWGFQGWLPWYGCKIYAPRGDHIMYQVAIKGTYEREVIQAIIAFTRPGTVFVDVGANLGLLSIAALQNPGATVHSFEPSPNSLKYLKQTHKEGGFGGRWFVHPQGCADCAGKSEFFVAKPGLGAFDGLADTGRAGSRTSVEVELVTLDEEWTKWGRPEVSVVKVDVEGSEWRVWLGMRELLNVCRPAVILEWNLNNIRRAGINREELFKLARDSRMSIFDPETFVPIQTGPQLDLLLLKGKDTYLLVPNEQLKACV